MTLTDYSEFKLADQMYSQDIMNAKPFFGVPFDASKGGWSNVLTHWDNRVPDQIRNINLEEVEHELGIYSYADRMAFRQRWGQAVVFADNTVGSLIETVKYTGLNSDSGCPTLSFSYELVFQSTDNQSFTVFNHELKLSDDSYIYTVSFINPQDNQLVTYSDSRFADLTKPDYKMTVQNFNEFINTWVNEISNATRNYAGVPSDVWSNSSDSACKVNVFFEDGDLKELNIISPDLNEDRTNQLKDLFKNYTESNVQKWGK